MNKIPFFYNCGHRGEANESDVPMLEKTDCAHCHAAAHHRAISPKRIQREVGRALQPHGGRRPERRIVELMEE